MNKKRFFFFLSNLFLLFLNPLEAVSLDPATHMALSSPQYAKFMEVTCLIVNQEQLTTIFTNPNQPIIQLTNNQLLNSSEIYLFVRVKNTGRYIPFGTLHVFVPDVQAPFPLEVIKMFKGIDCFRYALRLDLGVLKPNDQQPTLSYKWDCLYRL